MFDRVAYKKAAREQIRGSTGILALITLVYFFIFYGVSFWIYDEFPPLSIVALCVFGIIEIAWVQVLFKTSHKQPDEKIVFKDFINGLSNWLQGMLAYLWMVLWIFLWSLLLFVPGIIKAISYSMLFYILAENPDISVRKAMKMSMAMTKGYKGELFVLSMSFLGWAILCVLTCGILTLWIAPYYGVSMVNAYLFLKEKALRSGVLTDADFTGAASASNGKTSDTTTHNTEQTTQAVQEPLTTIASDAGTQSTEQAVNDQGDSTTDKE